MSSLLTIEEEIQNLPEQDFVVFREWFADHDSKKWDNQIEVDAVNGKLDELANVALNDFKDGKCKVV